MIINPEIFSALFGKSHSGGELLLPNKAAGSVSFEQGMRFEGQVVGRQGGVNFISVKGAVIKARSDVSLPMKSTLLLEVVESGTPAKVRLLSVGEGSKSDLTRLNREFINLKASLAETGRSLLSSVSGNRSMVNVSEIKNGPNTVVGARQAMLPEIAERADPERVMVTASFVGAISLLAPSVDDEMPAQFISSVIRLLSGNPDKDVAHWDHAYSAAEGEQDMMQTVQNGIGLKDGDGKREGAFSAGKMDPHVKHDGLTFVFDKKELDIVRYSDGNAPNLEVRETDDVAEMVKAALLPEEGESVAVDKGVARDIRHLVTHADMLFRYQQHMEQQTGIQFFMFPFWFAEGEGRGHWSWWKDEGECSERSDSAASHLAFDLELTHLGQVNIHLLMTGREISLDVTAGRSALHFIRRGMQELENALKNAGYSLVALDILSADDLPVHGPVTPFSTMADNAGHVHIVT